MARSPSGRLVRSAFVTLVTLAALGLAPVPSIAQQPGGWIEGAVRDADGDPIPFTAVQVAGTARGAVTAGDGTFRVGPVPAGEHRLRLSHIGYQDASRAVTVAGGGTSRIDVTLAVSPVQMAGIDVRVLRPDLRPEVRIEEDEVREASPQDTGEVFRALPGADAVRRGPLGLDPVVRGLRETQVGAYVDGTRVFPAGPARMDSPLSHFDPYAIHSLEVVKGPYALTWGAGNLTAIRVESQALPVAGPARFGGRVAAGFESNIDAAETMASLSGYQGSVAWWAFGAWRKGEDYESGRGDLVEGDFDSWEARAKVGFDLGPGSRLTVSGGWQDQGPIDYPGRLLTADHFRHGNASVAWRLDRPAEGALRSFEALAYVNTVDHGMDNTGKPTRLPMEGRMPSFALDIVVDTESTTTGGRAAAILGTDGWEIELGGDVYSVDRSATRRISNLVEGTLLFEDLIWPGVRITDAGVFGRANRGLGGILWSGSARIDFVRADADTVGAFFAENVGTDLASDETNLSAALTASIDPHPNWTLSLGVGTAVRTADALERYSDRFPSSRAQTSAEFMGNPALDPERSTQGDVWLEGAWPRAQVQLNAFARVVSDYITVEPTELPKRLPLSPPTVFRYVNGEARFHGFEASAAVALTDALTLESSAAAVWGDDDRFDDAAFGVPPPDARLGLRWSPPGAGLYLEGSARAVARQDRVVPLLNEGETPGYATVDLRSGIDFAPGLELRLGVDNLFDKAYVNHLNARNPFTTRPVPEPGRVWIVNAAWTF